MQRALWSGQPATRVGVVMIIDDSHVTRKILEVCLSRAGFSWASYPDGVQALVALKQQPDFVPGVVVLDVRLPYMDGFTLARLLRSRPEYDATAIIFLTGFDSFLCRLRARVVGVECFLTKPFKTTEIVAAVSRYVRVPATLLVSHAQGGDYACPIDAPYGDIPAADRRR